MVENPQHKTDKLSATGRYLTDSEIKNKIRQALNKAYLNTSNPCITKIESELIKELLNK